MKEVIDREVFIGDTLLTIGAIECGTLTVIRENVYGVETIIEVTGNRIVGTNDPREKKIVKEAYTALERELGDTELNNIFVELSNTAADKSTQKEVEEKAAEQVEISENIQRELDDEGSLYHQFKSIKERVLYLVNVRHMPKKEVAELLGKRMQHINNIINKG